MEQFREWSSAPLHLGVVAIKKGAFGSHSTKVSNFTFYLYIYIYIVIHRQTVSLYHNSAVWLDLLDASSWNKNSADFLSCVMRSHSILKEIESESWVLTLKETICISIRDNALRNAMNVFYLTFRYEQTTKEDSRCDRETGLSE